MNEENIIRADHFDMMFRYTCHCGQVNAPIIEIRDFDANGTEALICSNCHKEYKVNWSLAVEAELAMNTDPEVEATIWDDYTDDFDDEDGDEDEDEEN